MKLRDLQPDKYDLGIVDGYPMGCRTEWAADAAERAVKDTEWNTTPRRGLFGEGHRVEPAPPCE